MIKKAFGGILLVDEAYYLYNAANEKDYGQESIEILLNVMEEQKDDLIVTLAGCAAACRTHNRCRMTCRIFLSSFFLKLLEWARAWNVRFMLARDV